MEHKPCIHLDYESNYPSCTLCTAAPYFPNVRYWKRNEVPYQGAPVKVQFCKQRGRINGIFACYQGELPCYEPAKDAPQNTMEGLQTANNSAMLKLPCAQKWLEWCKEKGVPINLHGDIYEWFARQLQQ